MCGQKVDLEINTRTKKRTNIQVSSPEYMTAPSQIYCPFEVTKCTQNF